MIWLKDYLEFLWTLAQGTFVLYLPVLAIMLMCGSYRDT